MLPVACVVKAIMGPSTQQNNNCMQPDDDRMIESCCGNNIGREEELLR
jgi:hypothetical protein